MADILIQISENVSQSTAVVSPAGDAIAVNLTEVVGEYGVSVTQGTEALSVNVIEAVDEIAVAVEALTPEIVVNVSEGGAVEPGGGSDASYLHEQTAPSATWTVTHMLGKYPSVTVVDSSHDEVVGSVNHVSINQTVISFSAAFAGRAFFN